MILLSNVTPINIIHKWVNTIYHFLFGTQYFDFLLVTEFSHIWMPRSSTAFCKVSSARNSTLKYQNILLPYKEQEKPETGCGIKPIQYYLRCASPVTFDLWPDHSHRSHFSPGQHRNQAASLQGPTYAEGVIWWC